MLIDTHCHLTYEIDPEHKSIITELKKEVKNADKIWLATDEDREGESISWHLCEVLNLPKIPPESLSMKLQNRH